MKEICEKRGELPFFGDAAVMLVRSSQFRQHGQETPPVIKATSQCDPSGRPCMAMSGVSFWGYDLGGFIIPVIPEMRSALIQKIIFPLYRWDFGCPYPEHMAKHRESLA